MPPDGASPTPPATLAQTLLCTIKSLTFGDSSCQAKETEDEFVLSSGYSSCGMEVMENVVSNEVRPGVGKRDGAPSRCLLDLPGREALGRAGVVLVGRQDKLCHWLTQFPHPKKWVHWVGYPLGSSRALNTSLALFLQVVIRLLSSSSPQRVRWTVNVLTHVVRGEQASGDSGPDPGKPMCLQCAPVSPSVRWGQYCSESCSQSLKSEGSSTNWLHGLGQIT